MVNVNGAGIDPPIEWIAFINGTSRKRPVYHADGPGSVAALSAESGETVQTDADEALIFPFRRRSFIVPRGSASMGSRGMPLDIKMRLGEPGSRRENGEGLMRHVPPCRGVEIWK